MLIMLFLPTLTLLNRLTSTSNKISRSGLSALSGIELTWNDGRSLALGSGSSAKRSSVCFCAWSGFGGSGRGTRTLVRGTRAWGGKTEAWRGGGAGRTVLVCYLAEFGDAVGYCFGVTSARWVSPLVERKRKACEMEVEILQELRKVG